MLKAVMMAVKNTALSILKPGPGPITENGDGSIASKGTAASVSIEGTADLLPLSLAPSTVENERPRLGLSKRGAPYSYCDFE